MPRCFESTPPPLNISGPTAHLQSGRPSFASAQIWPKPEQSVANCIGIRIFPFKKQWIFLQDTAGHVWAIQKRVTSGVGIALQLYIRSVDNYVAPNVLVLVGEGLWQLHFQTNRSADTYKVIRRPLAQARGGGEREGQSQSLPTKAKCFTRRFQYLISTSIQLDGLAACPTVLPILLGFCCFGCVPMPGRYVPFADEVQGQSFQPPPSFASSPKGPGPTQHHC